LVNGAKTVFLGRNQCILLPTSVYSGSIRRTGCPIRCPPSFVTRQDRHSLSVTSALGKQCVSNLARETRKAKPNAERHGSSTRSRSGALSDQLLIGQCLPEARHCLVCVSQGKQTLPHQLSPFIALTILSTLSLNLSPRKSKHRYSLNRTRISPRLLRNL